MIHVYSYALHGHLRAGEHFKIEEFACINRQEGRVVDGKPYALGELVTDQILLDEKLVEQLELLRKYFGQSVRILSGYRSYHYNKAVGGAPSSKHMEGRAADIVVAGTTPDEVWEYANAHIRYGGVGRYDTFTHIDCRVQGFARWDLRKTK